MAANIPPKLKPAGITPFIIRAVQLESAKPVIAYWCTLLLRKMASMRLIIH